MKHRGRNEQARNESREVMEAHRALDEQFCAEAERQGRAVHRLSSLAARVSPHTPQSNRRWLTKAEIAEAIARRATRHLGVPVTAGKRIDDRYAFHCAGETVYFDAFEVTLAEADRLVEILICRINTLVGDSEASRMRQPGGSS